MFHPRGDTGTDWIAPWLDQARRSNGWLILFTPDVDANPGAFGCTADMLAATVDVIHAAGVEMLPLKDALGRVAAGHGR